MSELMLLVHSSTWGAYVVEEGNGLPAIHYHNALGRVIDKEESHGGARTDRFGANFGSRQERLEG